MLSPEEQTKWNSFPLIFEVVVSSLVSKKTMIGLIVEKKNIHFARGNKKKRDLFIMSQDVKMYR